MNDGTTICAIATPPGSGAIAIVRVSGNQAVPVTDSLFHPSSGKSLANHLPNTIHHGTIKDEKKIIDEVLVGLFKAPHSYTGEDTIEISCHGSLYIQQQIIQLYIKKGVRIAEPGEFTQRAFLNGKMDLSQAEGVADLIAAESAMAHKTAMMQMKGGYSNVIKNLREQLLQFTSLIELELDFGEEDVEFANRDELTKLVNHMDETVRKLLESFNLGNVIKKGIPVAIVGKTNVGKSTLLNTLLKEDRAIISEIEGTTRDSIEDVINVEGFLFRFIDTAGFRATKDKVESLGIERTYQKINQASVVLLMVDAKDSIKDINNAILGIKEKIQNPYTRLIIVINKIDHLREKDRQTKLKREHFSNLEPHHGLIGISAQKHDNIESLNSELLKSINIEPIRHNDVIITNVRHYDALRHVFVAISRVKDGLQKQLSGDLLSQDIRECLHYLGEITGEVTTDEVLGNIFNNFCIGK
jgi:tRNA modification GTPase